LDQTDEGNVYIAEIYIGNRLMKAMFILPKFILETDCSEAMFIPLRAGSIFCPQI